MTAQAVTDLDAKLERLQRALADTGGVLVAFSGGADSALLVAVARQALGSRAVAATGVSPSLAGAELDAARQLAAVLGVRHVVVETSELARPDYVRNGSDRCYFCKAELFDLLAPIAEAEGLALAVGTNADDLGDWRPGQRAAAERGVLTPLAQTGMTKADVRAASRRLGLPTASKPAAACLASRIAYGIAVTPARLARVERAEALIRSLGVSEVRVRDHGDLARVEVPLAALPRLVDGAARERLAAGLRDLGYLFVTLDLEGLQSGSLNRVLGANHAGAAPGALGRPPGGLDRPRLSPSPLGDALG